MKKHGLLGVVLAVFSVPVMADDVVINTAEQKTRVDFEKQISPPKKTINDKLQHTATDISTEQLKNNPELLKEVVYSAIVQKHIPILKIVLPLYETLPDKKLLYVDLAKASIYHGNNDFGQAIYYYRQALAKNNDLPIFRLALIEALLSNKQYDSAKKEIAILQKTKDIPQDISATLMIYQDMINKKSHWDKSVSFYYTQDKNVNNVSDINKIGQWTRNARKESAQGVVYQASLGNEKRLYDQYSWVSGVDIYGKSYWDNHRYDDMTTKVHTGIKFANAKQTMSVSPYFEKRRYGNQPYSDEWGVSVDWQVWLNQKHRMDLSAETGKLSHEKYEYLDGKQYQFSGHWIYFQNPRQYWVLGTNYGERLTQDKEDSYKNHGIRIGMTRQWTKKGFYTSVNFNHQNKRYQGVDIFNIHRQDKEYSLNVGLWHNQLQYQGFRPKLVATWYKNDSNHAFYDYKKNHIYLQIQKAF